MCIRDSPKIAAIYADTDLATLQAWQAFSTIDAAAPVSYTHLDVYKRQVRTRPASPSISKALSLIHI